VGHQEGARDPRKHEQLGGGRSQFRVLESDVESNSESRTTFAFNLTYMTRPTFDLGDLHMHGKQKEIIFPMEPVRWSTKIGLGHNHQNKIDFQKLFGVAPPILGRWLVYKVGVY
jgi:hypothetical protein